jgi:DNA-binding response OmpR family regulator
LGGDVTTPSARQGARILVAEDEFLVAIQLEEDLIAAGWSVLGPFTSLQTATVASRQAQFDMAILDVNLNGEMVYPLATELKRRGVGLLLVSGYEAANLPEALRGLPRMSKPYDTDALIRRVRGILEAG